MMMRVALIGAMLAGTAFAEEGVIDPRADAQLRKMSDYLSQMQSFRVDTTTVDEKVTTDGQKIQELKESAVVVKRPNKLRVDRTGPRGHAILRYDGKQLSLFADDQNRYAVMPAPSDLDAAIDHAREKLHADAPGGDLLVSDPYQALTDGIVKGHYVGLEPVEGKLAHHLAMTGDKTDWQIWIADGPQPVPLRYVITSKDVPGQPEFTLEAHHWRSDPTVKDQTFTFTPPGDAVKVDLTPKSKSRMEP